MLMLVYLLGGLLHGLSEPDIVSQSSLTRVMLSIGDADDPSGKSIIAENHCHGCFSVAVPLPMAVAMPMARDATGVTSHEHRASDLVSGIATPPPKILT